MQVNVFTNSLHKKNNLVLTTLESFKAKFGEHDIRVYCDTHPNTQGADRYIMALSRMFNVTVTSSLSDGYIKSINDSGGKYAFQLEHDWLFLDGITHSLTDITDAMYIAGIAHMRFNKRVNKVSKWDTALREDRTNGVAYCLTPCVSNNPHIIDTSYYKDSVIGSLQRAHGKRGIEETLSNTGIKAAIYGPLGYAATIQHIGRQCR